MKFPVHVLAWPLTLSVALSKEEQIAAESAVKKALLEQDEKKYKDADVHLDLKDKIFLNDNDQSEAKPSIRKKKHMRRHQVSQQNDTLARGEKSSLSDDEATDLGNLKLYQVEGPLDGLQNGSAVSSNEDEAEKIYMMIDRQDSTATTRQEKASVQMEGGIRLDGSSPNNVSKQQGIDSQKQEGANKPRMTRRRPGKRQNDPKKRRHPTPNDNERRLSRRLFLNSNQGEATGKSLHDNKVLLNGCVQGTSSFVTEQCRFFNCCQGDNACDWPDDQIATVCPNSCNGYKACYYIGAGTYIGRDSCNSGYFYDDDKPCAYFASFSKRGSSRIGQNACNGDYACLRICYSSNDCQATIGNNACNGERYPCVSIGEPSRFKEFSNLLIESVFVGDGSCINTDPGSYSACGRVGSFARSVHIGKESCIGSNSCYDVGFYAPLRVRVGDMSCTDFRACAALGYYAGFDGYKSKVTIGDKSCTGYESCFVLGYSTYRNVQVGDSACTNYKSCRYFARNVDDSDVLVRNDQCRTPNICSGNANGVCLDTTTVPNGGGSCPAP